MAGAGKIFSFELTGDWEGIVQMLGAYPRRIRSAKLTAGKAAAQHIAGKMRENFRKVEPPNAKITKKLKGSSKALVDMGLLRASITVMTPDEGEWFIGVSAAAGHGLVRLAAIHEEGITIVQVMTEKQRRFLHAVYRRFKIPPPASTSGTPGIIVIHIPARPFIRPTFEQEQQRAGEIFMAVFIQELTK